LKSRKRNLLQHPRVAKENRKNPLHPLSPLPLLPGSLNPKPRNLPQSPFLLKNPDPVQREQVAEDAAGGELNLKNPLPLLPGSPNRNRNPPRLKRRKSQKRNLLQHPRAASPPKENRKNPPHPLSPLLNPNRNPPRLKRRNPLQDPRGAAPPPKENRKDRKNPLPLPQSPLNLNRPKSTSPRKREVRPVLLRNPLSPSQHRNRLVKRNQKGRNPPLQQKQNLYRKIRRFEARAGLRGNPPSPHLRNLLRKRPPPAKRGKLPPLRRKRSKRLSLPLMGPLRMRPCLLSRKHSLRKDSVMP